MEVEAVTQELLPELVLEEQAAAETAAMVVLADRMVLQIEAEAAEALVKTAVQNLLQVVAE